ncbi:hypothetical protein KC331_g226 [Hortaea werneckii]|nr:hypothetical protein KC331_g226 [Hortaea werneckii]KAI7722701.1 hypothetical protein KC353_g263 [Hortaea werneckii]
MSAQSELNSSSTESPSSVRSPERLDSEFIDLTAEDEDQSTVAAMDAYETDVNALVGDGLLHQTSVNDGMASQSGEGKAGRLFKQTRVFSMSANQEAGGSGFDNEKSPLQKGKLTIHANDGSETAGSHARGASGRDRGTDELGDSDKRVGQPPSKRAIVSPMESIEPAASSAVRPSQRYTEFPNAISQRALSGPPASFANSNAISSSAHNIGADYTNTSRQATSPIPLKRTRNDIETGSSGSARPSSFLNPPTPGKRLKFDSDEDSEDHGLNDGERLRRKIESSKDLPNSSSMKQKVERAWDFLRDHGKRIGKVESTWFQAEVDQGSMNRRVDQLEIQMAELKVEVAELKEQQLQNRKDIAGVEAQVDTMAADMENR